MEVKYTDNIEYAICDIAGKRKFSVNNDIIHVPTLHMYINSELYKIIDSRQTYDVLNNEIESICK